MSCACWRWNRRLCDERPSICRGRALVVETTPPRFVGAAQRQRLRGVRDAGGTAGSLTSGSRGVYMVLGRRGRGSGGVCNGGRHSYGRSMNHQHRQRNGRGGQERQPRDKDVRGEERVQTGEERERCMEIIVIPWRGRAPALEQLAERLRGDAANDCWLRRRLDGVSADGHARHGKRVLNSAQAESGGL